MRHGASSRRSRNRGNGGNGGKRGNNNRSQVFDSNGPDVRIRGTAYQVHEKYLVLAKDASSAGDLILSESYLQHAEHYQRIINSWTAESNDSYSTYESDKNEENEFDLPRNMMNRGNRQNQNENSARELAEA
jgi:hypothetical protein